MYERECSECGAVFKTEKDNSDSCFECIIVTFEPFGISGKDKAYDWDNLVKAYEISGQKIPRQYADLYAYHVSRKLEGMVRKQGVTGCRAHIAFSSEEKAMIE